MRGVARSCFSGKKTTFCIRGRRKWMEYLGDRWGTVCGRRQKMNWLREEERKQIFVKKNKKEDPY